MAAIFAPGTYYFGPAYYTTDVDSVIARGWGACADAAAALLGWAARHGARATLCVEAPPGLPEYAHVRVRVEGRTIDPYAAYRADVAPSCEMTISLDDVLRLATGGHITPLVAAEGITAAGGLPSWQPGGCPAGLEPLRRQIASHRRETEIASAAIAVLGYALIGSIFLSPYGAALLTVSAFLTWLAGDCEGQGVTMSAARQAGMVLGFGAAALPIVAVGPLAPLVLGIVGPAAAILADIGSGGAVHSGDVGALISGIQDADDSGAVDDARGTARALGVDESTIARAVSRASTGGSVADSDVGFLKVAGKTIAGFSTPWLVWRLLRTSSGRAAAPALTSPNTEAPATWATAAVRVAEDIPRGTDLRPLVHGAAAADRKRVSDLVRDLARSASTAQGAALMREASRTLIPLAAYLEDVETATASGGALDVAGLAQLLSDPTAPESGPSIPRLPVRDVQLPPIATIPRTPTVPRDDDDKGGGGGVLALLGLYAASRLLS